MEKKLHVHFMGIGGSGTAPVAIIAKKLGFTVSGCDMNLSSYYGDSLKENSIDILNGHSADHLEGVDIVAVSPAIFDISPDNPELLEAKRRNILMTWQEFMGSFLQKDKKVIAFAGTHGKSTTTILAGVTLIDGGLDPIVEAGTIYKPWGSGYHLSNSEYFVCEADEFNNNFLNYSASIIVINNIEMDHPEFFKDFEDFKDSFKKFIKNIKKPGTLIVNEESQGVREVLSDMKTWLVDNNIKVIGYFMEKHFDFPFDVKYRAKVTKYGADSIEFDVVRDAWSRHFKLGMTGEHNVQNSMGVLCAAIDLGVDVEAICKTFENYKGIGRRSELVGKVNNIMVYDDYGHHPTAIEAVLNTFKKSYENKRIWAVYEPHQISRLRMFFKEFANALNRADKVVVTKTFVGREIHKNLQPVDMNDFITEISEEKAKYIEEFNDVVDYISKNAAPGDVIVVFGAGNSHRLTRDIISALKMNSR